MTPMTYDLHARRGDTFDPVTFRFKQDETTPRDLTGTTFAAQVREHPDASRAVPFVVTVSPLTGEVTLNMPATSTALLPSLGVWDLQASTVGGGVTVVQTWLAGDMITDPDVTR